ncbi:hypothetical protein FC82_GL001990 [Secundilactobacillus collinoides DSM 20515 = JCM 1123]|uniref:Uncharacterized protein n=1 Tax=Secundilactobacillus collinoides DSM 20515 = JCM 1123 TaxID=1423733 RepID=A0A0R2BA33_SECCO|nr:hypothetical protein FC82_GL001990 [Secundilactobacillus collinoides DSM 20515 = JCM 1123]
MRKIALNNFTFRGELGAPIIVPRIAERVCCTFEESAVRLSRKKVVPRENVLWSL